MLNKVLQWESACEGQKGRAVDLATTRGVQKVLFVELVTPNCQVVGVFILFKP